MKIQTLWGTREYAPDTPELMVAWDEYSCDANYEGYQKQCADAKASWGSDLYATREILIDIDYDAVARAFTATEIEGEVQ